MSFQGNINRLLGTVGGAVVGAKNIQKNKTEVKSKDESVNVKQTTYVPDDTSKATEANQRVAERMQARETQFAEVVNYYAQLTKDGMGYDYEAPYPSKKEVKK